MLQELAPVAGLAKGKLRGDGWPVRHRVPTPALRHRNRIVKMLRHRRRSFNRAWIYFTADNESLILSGALLESYKIMSMQQRDVH